MSQKEFGSVKLSGWVYRKDETSINLDAFINDFTDWIESKGFCFIGVGCGDEISEIFENEADEEVEE